MIVGLTGASGAGKSSVARIFCAHGFFVVDLDQISREVYDQWPTCVRELVAAFGPGILDAEGRVLRKELGGIVFRDKKKLDMLNRITHKYILQQTYNVLYAHRGEDVLLDAPLLFESGLNRLCDITVCVVCPRGEKIRRIVQRDGLSQELAAARVSSQRPDSILVPLCDFTIHNTGSLETLKKRATALVEQILDDAR